MARLRLVAPPPPLETPERRPVMQDVLVTLLLAALMLGAISLLSGCSSWEPPPDRPAVDVGPTLGELDRAEVMAWQLLAVKCQRHVGGRCL